LSSSEHEYAFEHYENFKRQVSSLFAFSFSPFFGEIEMLIWGLVRTTYPYM
jgi:hypothetical protein